MSVFDSKYEKFDISVPAVIVGAGAAGLVAALSLSDNGITPMVFERDKMPYGSTGLSSGMIPACGTHLQTKEGIDDSAELLSSDIIKKARAEVDQSLVNAICKISGSTIDWLMESHGIDLTLVKGFLYPGHSRLRMHAPPSRQGQDLIGNLTVAAQMANIDLLTEACVTDLYRRGGEITGVKIRRSDGSSEILGCDVLILACNGFGGNSEMVRKYIPEISNAIYFGHPGNQGDAVNWGLELGAETRDLGSFQGHGSVAHPHGILITWALMSEGGILVNSNGKRFTNEHEGYSEQAKRVLRQRNGLAWCIFDQRLHTLGLEFGEYREANKLGAVKSASTIENLAATLTLPANELFKTLNECSDLTKGKLVDQFQRNFSSKPDLAPPYYGIQVTGALFHTQGGLVINEEAYVVNKEGRTFKNLLASGGAAAGISGPADWGYLSGNGLLSAVALGRIAGLSAADLLSKS